MRSYACFICRRRLRQIKFRLPCVPYRRTKFSNQTGLPLEFLKTIKKHRFICYDHFTEDSFSSLTGELKQIPTFKPLKKADIRSIIKRNKTKYRMPSAQKVPARRGRPPKKRDESPVPAFENEFIQEIIQSLREKTVKSEFDDEPQFGYQNEAGAGSSTEKPSKGGHRLSPVPPSPDQFLNNNKRPLAATMGHKWCFICRRELVPGKCRSLPRLKRLQTFCEQTGLPYEFMRRIETHRSICTDHFTPESFTRSGLLKNTPVAKRLSTDEIIDVVLNSRPRYRKLVKAPETVPEIPQTSGEEPSVQPESRRPFMRAILYVGRGGKRLPATGDPYELIMGSKIGLRNPVKTEPDEPVPKLPNVRTPVANAPTVTHSKKGAKQGQQRTGPDPYDAIMGPVLGRRSESSESPVAGPSLNPSMTTPVPSADPYVAIMGPVPKSINNAYSRRAARGLRTTNPPIDPYDAIMGPVLGRKNEESSDLGAAPVLNPAPEPPVDPYTAIMGPLLAPKTESESIDEVPNQVVPCPNADPPVSSSERSATKRRYVDPYPIIMGPVLRATNTKKPSANDVLLNFTKQTKRVDPYEAIMGPLLVRKSRPMPNPRPAPPPKPLPAVKTEPPEPIIEAPVSRRFDPYDLIMGPVLGTKAIKREPDEAANAAVPKAIKTEQDDDLTSFFVTEHNISHI